jgi:hypothetical protein
MKANERCCQTCEFFESPADDKGTCHFNAPFPSMKSPMMNEKFFDGATITWPQVASDNWCGRFKERS